VVGFLKPLVFSLALTTSLPAAAQSLAKSPAESDSPQTGVVVVKLTAPIYPPLARATHIVGDVELNLSIRQDGSLESATAVSGHPLLTTAALDSAQHTQFECRKCSEPATDYRLVYTFQLEVVSECEPVASKPKTSEPGQTYPRVTDATNRVTVTALVVCISDPAPDVRKVRSLKCVYLWRCSTR
jgi:hypothetical protein